MRGNEIIPTNQTVIAANILIRACNAREIKTITNKICMLYKRDENHQNFKFEKNQFVKKRVVSSNKRNSNLQSKRSNLSKSNEFVDSDQTNRSAKLA